MRKAFIILTGIIFTLLTATCKQFTADIDDYLGYWAAEAYITDSSIKAVVQNDVNSIASVPSAEDVPITFTLQNPKSFPLDLPPEADAEKNVIVFEHLPKAPVAGRDYTLTQSEDRQSLLLTYKASFLQAHEWGEQDLSSVLTLYATDGRKFKQTYTFTVKANTPPPKPVFTVVKTKGSPAYYVLCIMAPGMDKKVPGGLLHKDLARVEINETSYSFSVNEAQTAFTKPEGDVFITRSEVEKLTEPGADDVPAGGWALYYKTDVEVKDGAVKKEYTVRLADAQGLVSDILNASTKPNKAEAEQVRITKGTVSGSGSGDADNPVIIGTDSSGAVLSVSSATANTTVHCTVSEIGGSTPVKYDGNPVTVPLPLNGAGEKRYKLEYYTDGEGFAATPVKTIYYKVVQGHTVIFDANEGAYPDGAATVSKTALHGTRISQPDPPPTRVGYGVTGWYKSADGSGAAWNFDTDTVTGDIRLYAKWMAGVVSYTVEHYQQNIDETYPSSATETESKTGATGQSAAYNSKTYEGFTYRSTLTEINGVVQTSGTIAGDNSTVVKLYYQPNDITVTFNLDGGNIGGNPSNVTKTGKYGAAFTAPVNPDKTGYTFSSWQPVGDAPALSLTFPAKNAEYKANWTANTYTVRFSVYGGTGGTLKAKPEGSTEKTTRTTDTVSVEHGKKVDFTAEPDEGYEVDGWTGATAGTPNTTATLSNVTTDNINVIMKFKKKVYEVTFSVAAGEGSLKGEGGGYINTATGNTSETLTVPHGGNVDFTATPATSGSWEVAEWKKGNVAVNGTNSTYMLSNVTADTTVTVKFYQSEIDGTAPMAWRALLNAVRDAPKNATIKINGEIKATIANDNKGEIVINKNLTIKGKTGAGSDKLNAITLSRIFKVKDGTALTLENITLKNGEADNGGGVYNEGTLIMKGSATVAPSAGAGKNDVYLASGAMITVNSTLSPTDGIAAYITPGSYAEGRQVLNGSGFGSGYYKFEVTPESSTAEWVIKSDGCLKKAKDVVSSSSATPWKDLKTVITSAHDGDIIVINGEIKATAASDNNGGITINKSITIKGKNKDTAILNANKDENGKFPHYIFFVNGGKTVTLQNLTLTGGINSNKGGAIHIGASTHGNTVKMINCIIKDNTATGDGGGGVYIGRMGTFTMDGESSRITNNYVSGTGTGFAVYIDDEGTFNWIKGSISNNGGSDKAVHKEPDGEFNNPENYTAY